MRKLTIGLGYIFAVMMLMTPAVEAKKAQVKKHRRHHVVRQNSCNTAPTLTGLIGLQRVVEEMNRHASAGVVVESLHTGEMLYQQNANQLFSPASNMKVITAFAALKFLGPQFVYQTRLLTDATATINHGLLDGNLYIQYQGDPSLQLEDVNALMHSLGARGVKTIRGRLMVDASRYADESISPGTELHDQAYCYGAPVSTATLNRNCVSFKVAPGKPGSAARLMFPYGVPLPIDNAVVTGGSRYCHVALQPSPAGRYRLQGCIRPHSQPTSLMLALPAQSHYGDAAAMTFLARNGIQVMGAMLPVVPEAQMQVLAVHESEPLSELVVTMMKRSDNLIASALFKTVGAFYNHMPATWENSAVAVKAILDKNQVNTDGMQIYDGSGLSRENRVTPMQLVQVLVAAYRDPAISAVYLSALPEGGLNGTLRHRLGSHDVIGKVKAKTGTMHGVSSLSGYVEGQTGEMVAFSIIVNDFTGGIYFYHAMQDKLCRVMRASY